MKKNLLALMMAAIMCSGLTACGAAGTSTTTPSTTSSDTNPSSTEITTGIDNSNSESSANTLGDTDDEENSNQSNTNQSDKKLSGKVVVYMPSPKGLNSAYIKGFQEKSGVQIELFEGTTGEILARLEAEKNNPVADVVVLASWTDGLLFKEQGNLTSYTPENVEKLYDGWVDEDSMLFGTSASALGVIYNTTIIETLNVDWDGLTDEKYAKEIVIPDPEKSGSCKDFLSGYLYANKEDWSVWEQLAANGMTVPGANKAALEAVTTGEKGILVAGVDYNAYSSIAAGEPLAIYYPESGTVINPRPAMILKSSKNMDNAKAFVDYLLSDEAQNMVADAYLLPGRKDITCSNRDNVRDIPTFNIDWQWMMEHSTDIAAHLNELCNK